MLTTSEQTRSRDPLGSIGLWGSPASKQAADQGGLDSETSFEQAFSSLAHSYLRDKAPGLLDHEIGFQLLERNEDNTRAVGIFGFKVGPSWLYAPVFFLNGDLKGHELLYLKNQDMFCPLNEGWLNYLLSRKPPILGEEVTRNSRELGVLPPDIQQLKRNPYKYASTIPLNAPPLAGWATEVLPNLAVAINGTPKIDLQVPGLLKASSSALVTFLELCESYPVLAKISLDTYGEGVIKAAVQARCRRASSRGGCACPRCRGLLGDLRNSSLHAQPSWAGRGIGSRRPLRRGDRALSGTVASEPQRQPGGALRLVA